MESLSILISSNSDFVTRAIRKVLKGQMTFPYTVELLAAESKRNWEVQGSNSIVLIDGDIRRPSDLIRSVRSRKKPLPKIPILIFHAGLTHLEIAELITSGVSDFVSNNDLVCKLVPKITALIKLV